MGWLSWLWPSPEDRIARAHRLLERGRWANARAEVQGIDLPAAHGVDAIAREGLTRDNLDAAESWARAGDDERVHLHLSLAEELRVPGMDDAFRATRRTIREGNAEREHKRSAAEQARAKRDAVDPLGLTGSSALADGVPAPDLSPDDAERSARVALVVENYPPALKVDIGSLGAPFATAVLNLEDGRADLALQGLLALPEDHPAVIWETTRAAYALGDAVAAARTLRRLPDLAGGHQHIGTLHTGTYLAQLVAEVGDTQEALRILRDTRATDPHEGSLLFATLLEATGALEDAEKVLVAAIRRQGKALPYYAVLARVRLKGGHRVQAMQALERAMDQCACGTGQCGKVAPDVAIVRPLATLYLEEGDDIARGLALADQARGLVQSPSWEDAYLVALAGRHQNSGPDEGLTERLYAGLAADDPRRAQLDTHLAQTA